MDREDPTGQNWEDIRSDVADFLDEASNDLNALGPDGGELGPVAAGLGDLIRGGEAVREAGQATEATVDLADRVPEATQLERNVAQGKAGEAATRAKLGGKVAGEQVTFKTSTGARTRADFVTTDKSVVETKTGKAALSPGQAQLKSDIGAGRSVTPVGANAEKAGLKSGEPVKMTCFREDHPC